MLLDDVLPEYDVSKRHAIRIAAPPDRLFDALTRHDIGSSLVTRALMGLRGYGRRMRETPSGRPLVEAVTAFGFTPLGEVPGEELVFGLVGKFWRPDGGLRPVTAEEFGSFAEPGYAKAAWNLRVRDVGPAGSELSTETRVFCLGADARRRFLRYWRFVEPFSGLIRRSLLRGVARSLSPQGRGSG